MENYDDAKGAWKRLRDLIRAEVLATASAELSSLQFRWPTDRRLTLTDPWSQVEVRFVEDPKGFSVQFDRYNSQAGALAFEATPGSVAIPPENWRLHFVSEAEGLWFLEDQSSFGQLTLARRIVEGLLAFHRRYKQAAVNPPSNEDEDAG